MRIAGAATHVLEAVAGRLGGEVPGRVYLTPGAVPAWDDCCSKQLTVRVINVTPWRSSSRTDPGRSAPDPSATIVAWVVRLGVTFIRCVSTVDDLGRAPKPEVMQDEAADILDTAEKILAALLCDVAKHYRLRPLMWTSVGPEGGCAGGEWELEVDVPD